MSWRCACCRLRNCHITLHACMHMYTYIVFLCNAYVHTHTVVLWQQAKIRTRKNGLLSRQQRPSRAHSTSTRWKTLYKQGKNLENWAQNGGHIPPQKKTWRLALPSWREKFQSCCEHKIQATNKGRKILVLEISRVNAVILIGWSDLHFVRDHRLAWANCRQSLGLRAWRLSIKNLHYRSLR